MSVGAQGVVDAYHAVRARHGRLPSFLPFQVSYHARSRRREGEAEHGSVPRAERSGRPLGECLDEPAVGHMPSCASKPKRAFACWFHTHFVENGRLRLTKCELDKACKDKKASPDLRVSIKFHRVTGPRTWRPPPRSKRAPSPNNVVP